MIPEFKTLDDLKTDRPDIAPPLPLVFRLIPVLFYTVTAGCLFLLGLFYLQIRNFANSRDEWRKQESAFKQQLAQLKTERSNLEGRAKRASDLSDWVETTRALQPLLVKISRSISQESAITEMSFARLQDDPKQIRFSIKLATSTPAQQLERVVAVLAEAGYRNYSPEQKLSRGSVDYTSTLLRQVTQPVSESAPAP